MLREEQEEIKSFIEDCQYYESVLYLEKNYENILNVLQFFKEEGFEMLIDIFAVDYPGSEKRIEINYLLLDIKANKRAQIKININPAIEFVPSSTKVFISANWFEREIYDMNGVTFANHPNLERILTDYDFEGHPLLKDFPLSGYKEVRYNIESKKVEYEDVNLSQEYRTFDFLTPWEGTKYIEETQKKEDNQN